MKAWVALFLGIALPAAAAEDSATREALAWLKKMAAASRQLNYAGTFVFQYGAQSETSRIVHFVNSAGGEIEKLETLDGPPREVIRTNDQVTCYLPASKTVLVDQRGGSRFPALLPTSPEVLVESYAIRTGGTDRVAGRECQVVLLLPRDRLRYGHRLCADRRTALPLRKNTFDEYNELVESFAFTEVRIGIPFSRDSVRSRYAEKSRGWRVDRSSLAAGAAPGESEWTLTSELPGFRKLAELKRTMTGRAAAVAQIVLSDGVAAVSVFIEPMPRTQPARRLIHRGAVSIYTRPLADHLVTVLGEAPLETVVRIADSLEPKGQLAGVREP
jgi:sigma-E factor negative regulatory protein RseB